MGLRVIPTASPEPCTSPFDDIAVLTDPLAVLLRFALYVVLSLMFGLLAFRQYSPAPTRLAGRQVITAIAVFALVLSGIGLVELAARMHGLGLAEVGLVEVATILSLPGLGNAFGVRIAALLANIAVMAIRPGRGRIALVLSGVALVCLAWQGHAGATEGRAGLGHLLATALHLLAAGIWLGALVMFLVMSARARTSEIDRGTLVASLMRFHGVGTMVVVTLALTGSVALLMIAGWPLPAAAFQSSWWWLLALKLVVFVAMLGLAAANRFRLAPGLAAGQAHAVQWIRRSIALELALGVFILALVAWLGLLAPDPG